MRKFRQSRRATVLLMVVSVLALLFVVIITFITITRSDRATIRDLQKSNVLDAVVEYHRNRALELMVQDIRGADGRPLSGPAARYEQIPGYKLTSYIAAFPGWSEGVNNIVNALVRMPNQVAAAWNEFGRLVLPAVTRLNPSAADKPTDITSTTAPRPPYTDLPGWPTPPWRFIPENELDRDPGNPTFEYDDLTRYARNPLFDADGNGLPDAWIDYQAEGIEFANSLAGTPVRIRSAGISITENPFPSQGPNPGGGADPAGRAWMHFLNNARYGTSMTIYNHGGMVAIDAASIGDGQNRYYQPFNRNFTARLLNSFRNPNDPSIFTWTNVERNTMFDAVARDRATIESLLRRRFGLPSATMEYVNNSPALGRASVPPALALLQGEVNVSRSLAFTFLPQFPSVGSGGRISPVNPSLRMANATYKLNPFEPFNVSLADELRAATNSMALPTAWMMVSQSNNLNNPLAMVNQRQFITTTSNSDEIARKQNTGDPLPQPSVGARFRTATPANPGTGSLFDGTSATVGSTYSGELKFPLTEVAKAFELVTVTNPALLTATATPSGATSATGNDHFRYVPHRGQAPNATYKVGDEVVERMARLIYDMLTSHSGSNDDWNDLVGGDDDDNYDGDPDAPAPNGKEAVTRRQQALMLAVNIVAFAMPRDTNSAMRGYVDVVTYKDGLNGVEYIGYGPQPFITEAIAYFDDEPGENLAIAIELFNPNDPGYDSANVDAFALWTQQFGIEIVDADNGNVIEPVQPLGGPGYPTNFDGRTFGTVVMKKNTNGQFDGLANQLAPIRTVSGVNADSRILIRLKKRGWDPDSGFTPQGAPYEIRWYTVDQMPLVIPDDREADDDGEDEGREPSHDWASTWRDTTPYRLFAGFDNGGTGNPIPPQIGLARWSVVLPPRASQRTEQHSPNNGPPILTLGNPQHLNPGDGQTSMNPDLTPEFISPAVPMPLMNAGPFGAGSLVQQLNNLPMFGDARVTTGPDLALGDLRPRSFPTTGFLLYVPRFSHVITASRTYTMSDVLFKSWNRRGGASAQPGQYPADFGHMPIFDNRQSVTSNSYLSDGATQNNRVPWGQLIFDYFTTIDPTATGVDPLKIPGRININVAPWFVLQHTPIIGPDFGNAVPQFSAWPARPMPIRRNWTSNLALTDVQTYDPAPSFWDPRVGVMVGEGQAREPFFATDGYQRNLLTDQLRDDRVANGAPARLPTWNPLARQWQLGPWLAQSLTAYRDGYQVLPFDTTTGNNVHVYADAHLRGGIGEIRNLNQATLMMTMPYRPTIYGAQTGLGSVRGAVNQAVPNNTVDAPTEFGFLSIGELANVKGFDSSKPRQLPPAQLMANAADTVLGRGDFMRAVSLLALIDSQYLTTRSNTFTAYVSVMDRAEPEASTRAQYTIDRTNMLPRIEYEYAFTPGPGQSLPPLRVRKLNLVTIDNLPETPVRYLPGPEARPAIIAEQRVGYFNSRFDD